MLAVVVGDDSGSRLYWDLVDPGHAEAAELGFNEYDGSGVWLSYLSCQPDQVDVNLERMRAICEDVNNNNITDAELELARNKTSSQIVLRSERPMGRLSALGLNWVYRNEYRSVTADLESCRAVSREDIAALLQAYPISHTTTVALGPLTELAIGASS